MEKQKRTPVLCFPEFNEDWRTILLEQVCDKTISYGIVQTGNLIENGISCVRVVDLTSEILDVSKMITTSIDISKSYKKTILEEDDIIFALRGVIGKVIKVSPDLMGCNITRGVARISGDKKQVFPDYMLWAIRSPRFIEELNKRVNGSALLEIPLSGLRAVPISITSLPEQTKIANFLTAVDNKLTQLKQKRNLLVQYKKGVMQKIFDREIRFKDDDGNEFPNWKIVMLGEIARIATGNSNREDSTLEGDYTFFDRSQDIRSSSIFLFDGEAIIVAGEGQEFIPKYFIGKFDLHQRTYSIMNFINANGKFLFYQIDKFRHYFFSQAVGSTVKSLRLPMFEKMPIQLPCFTEQSKIANFLTAIDEKINQCNNQIAKTEAYKIGLLQQLFV